ncbi:MAG: hypothetical protein Q7U20_10690 [Caulobacter sp.]|nr:hypothetical protein [Caulobacter sp.]
MRRSVRFAAEVLVVECQSNVNVEIRGVKSNRSIGMVVAAKGVTWRGVLILTARVGRQSSTQPVPLMHSRENRQRVVMVVRVRQLQVVLGQIDHPSR